MPLLGALIANLFPGLAAFFLSVLGRKIAVTAAALAGLATVTGALLLVFRGVINPLLSRAFATQYGQFIGLAFPPVAGDCLVAIGTTWAACALYRWQRAAISIGVQA